MTRTSKIVIGTLIIGIIGVSTYYFFKKRKGGEGNNKTIGGDDSSEIIYDKSTRVIEIK